MDQYNRMSSYSAQQSGPGSVRQTLAVNQYESLLSDSRPVAIAQMKDTKTPSFEELPHDDKYYQDRYGVDKRTYFAFLQVDRFAYRMCLLREQEIYANPDYNPLFP